MIAPLQIAEAERTIARDEASPAIVELIDVHAYLSHVFSHRHGENAKAVCLSHACWAARLACFHGLACAVPLAIWRRSADFQSAVSQASSLQTRRPS